MKFWFIFCFQIIISQFIDIRQIPIFHNHLLNHKEMFVWSCIIIITLFNYTFSSVIVAESSASFSQILKDHPNVVVYFYSEKDCQYCSIFTETFAVVSLLMEPDNDLTFVKASYDNNAEAFTIHHVEAVPEIRFFHNGQQSIARYYQLDYTISSADLIVEWVRRVTGKVFTEEKHLKESESPARGLFSWIWDSEEEAPQKTARVLSETHQYDEIIVNCKNSHLLEALQKQSLFYRYLDIKFKCGKPSSSELLYRFSSNYLPPLALLESCILKDHTFSPNCAHNLADIRNRGLQTFSSQHINELYHTLNSGMFVLLTNNDTKSFQYLHEFMGIKKKWDQRAIINGKKIQTEDREELPIKVVPNFVVADIASEMSLPSQEQRDEAPVHRLKRFIGGYEYNGFPYPFPLLAYLKVDQKQKLLKFIYFQRTLNENLQIVVQKQKGEELQKKMQRWMKKSISGRQIDSYQRNEKEGAEYKGTQEYLQGIIEDTSDGSQIRVIGKELQGVLKILQDRNKNAAPEAPIAYMGVTYRLSYYLLNFKKEFVNWWGDRYHRYNIPFFNFDLYEADLPHGMRVDRLPAFVEFLANGNYIVHQGLSSTEEMKKVVRENFKKFGKTANEQQVEKDGE